jgi:glycosyltransferase involved in cell wall biosynthesis
MTDMRPDPHYDFTVITPSFNMLDYLRRCCASVEDQRGVSVQHLVIDGGSVDGSAEWLRSSRPDSSVIEPDDGMFDALNKGLERARGDYVCYLNCDEQHLPGALARASR